MNISLPIPELRLVSKNLVWVPYDVKEKASMHMFTIKSHESIGNLRNYLAEETLSKLGICS